MVIPLCKGTAGKREQTGAGARCRLLDYIRLKFLCLEVSWLVSVNY